MAGDGGFHCVLMSKCSGTMRTSKFGALPLKAQKKPICFSCAMGCAGTPHLFNALYSSALGRRDKGRKK